jgi:predicted nucleic acid-binding protein
MIVADTNLVAYLLIAGPFTEAAQATLLRDKDWVAPPLWRHEFLNILATSVRAGKLSEIDAMATLGEAPLYVRSVDHEQPMEVLSLSVASRIATYDCEFVILARRLSTRLVTADKELLRAFPDVAISPEQFAART